MGRRKRRRLRGRKEEEKEEEWEGGEGEREGGRRRSRWLQCLAQRCFLSPRAIPYSVPA